MAAPWATFDCYGTIVDWLGGMRVALAPVAGDAADRLLAAYHRHEPDVERERPVRPYREVLVEALRRAAAETSVALPAGEQDVLVRAWPGLPFHPDVAAGLRGLRDAGWRLAVLTNCDDDLFATTAARLPVALDLVITAEQVGAYKPDLAHFERFRERARPADGRWVHVAVSWFHDIEPASRLGIPRIWVDRERTGHDPSLASAVLPSFDRLPETAGRLLAA